MRTVSLVSINGGTGRTALTAHLGAILQQEQRRCLLVDADPRNALGHWFGMTPDERFGLARKGVDADDVLQFQREHRPDVPYVPFGLVTEAELAGLELTLQREPEWLVRRIGQLTGHEVDVALVDAPAGLGPWTVHAVRAADVVLAVLRPDPTTYAALPHLRRLLQQHAESRGAYRGTLVLLNGMDARSRLSRDIKAALADQLDDLLPVTVPWDEAVREAHAQGKTVLHTFPDSQVVASLRDVAGMLMARMDADATTGEVLVLQ